jgi:hypothetical protein
LLKELKKKEKEKKEGKEKNMPLRRAAGLIRSLVPLLHHLVNGN